MICKKCNAYFKTFVKIDGKLKNLCNRKYCLECSPYKKHNTTKLELKDNVKSGVESCCLNCGRKYVYTRKSGHSLGKCNTCWTNERRKEQKIKALEYLGNKCIICGYDRLSSALDFHHINPDEKDFDISTKNYIKWDILQKELDKCIIVCCRCHREIHAGVISETVITSDSKSDFKGSNPL